MFTQQMPSVGLLQIASSFVSRFSNIALAALDMAGTTVNEQGAVYTALEEAVAAVGSRPSRAQVHQWMGAGKREAITALLAATVARGA